MKPKQNHKADPTQSLTIDCCETPAYALDPLLPYLEPFKWIWEPACGSGRLVRALLEADHEVIGSDILDGYNFLTAATTDVDAIVTNPPYSIKPAWIRHCYELGKPFALLVPVETIGTGEVQRMMEQYGCELLLLNKRVNFFPVLWFCWRVLPQPIVYGRITRRKDEQLQLLEAV
jgi:hypothetical protein